MRFDLLVKVGGSLGRRPGVTARLMRRLAALAQRRAIVVVPGGGRFADLVRRERRRHRLPAASAHAMALLAMDQYGLLLAAAVPSARTVRTLAATRRVAASGRLAVFLVADRIGGARGLERTFRLTSDSIAAHLAGRIGARRLLLLKNVPGLDRTIAGRFEAGVVVRRGWVDPLFARHLPSGIEARLLDGAAGGAARVIARWLASEPPRGPRRPAGRAPGRSAPIARRRTARRAGR
jgi:aspartokinase-like uncharacterized kinase